MGNTSRDTFRLTNVLHQVATGEAVPDGRHYVGVRQQQGVPLLDADLNELEDIRRQELQLHLRHFFGSGIPDSSDGFRIGPVTVDNDLAIGTGLGLVAGWAVVNLQVDLTYLGQAAAFGVTLPALTPPGFGVRDDLVYLDVWEEEVLARDGSRADGRLIHPLIGLETCTRIERRWVVRVAEGVTDPLAVALPAGHALMALARLHRVEAEPRIRAARIFDLRRTDLNVVKYLKVPARVERGPDLVDSSRLAEVFRGLRETLLSRLEANDLLFSTASDHDRNVVQFALQHILQVSSTAELQARTNALTEGDALQALSMLADAQGAFLAVHANHGDAGVVADAFRADYHAHLDGSATLSGVYPGLTAGDLIAAYLGQQTLNAWLSAPVGTLPEGDVAVEYVSVNPVEALQAGHAYIFTVLLTSNVTSDRSDEVFDVTVLRSSDLWAVDRTTDQITLTNAGGHGTLSFTLVPSAGNPQCVFQVKARVQRNPAIESTQLGLPLELGNVPPVGSILLYAGPPLTAEDRIPIPAAALSSGFGTSLAFQLSNRTDQAHTYRLEWYVTLSGGVSETGWTPIASAKMQNNYPVPPQSVGGADVAVSAPSPLAPDVVGTLHVTLLSIDAAPPPAEQAVSLDLPFITT